MKVEKRVKEKLVEALLDAHIKWHCRKGLRDCDCDYCLTKKAGTRYIGYTPFPLGLYKERLNAKTGEDASEIAREVVRAERDRKRNAVRKQLARIASEIL